MRASGFARSEEAVVTHGLAAFSARFVCVLPKTNRTVSSSRLLHVQRVARCVISASDTSLTLSAPVAEGPCGGSPGPPHAFDGGLCYADDWHCRVRCVAFEGRSHSSSYFFIIKAASSSRLSGALGRVAARPEVSHARCTRGSMLFLQLLPDKQSTHSTLTMTALRPSKQHVRERNQDSFKGICGAIGRFIN